MMTAQQGSGRADSESEEWQLDCGCDAFKVILPIVHDIVRSEISVTIVVATTKVSVAARGTEQGIQYAVASGVSITMKDAIS